MYGAMATVTRQRQRAPDGHPSVVLDGADGGHGIGSDAGLSVVGGGDCLRGIGALAGPFLEAGICLTAFISSVPRDREPGRPPAPLGVLEASHGGAAIEACGARDRSVMAP